jgi:hypothetical protein
MLYLCMIYLHMLPLHALGLHAHLAFVITSECHYKILIRGAINEAKPPDTAYLQYIDTAN